ncbi:MAG TPA: hypothetical protein VK470_06945 [Bacteroidota bacterium]|nr:hypothetical protein [Bacteroidota bacterium]
MGTPPSPSRKAEIETRLAAIEREKQELSQELNAILSAEQALLPNLSLAQLTDSVSTIPARVYGRPATSSPLTNADERIALFHQLFVCREDVFSKLWVNKQNGKKGYAPACKVEWVKGVCGKPAVKCGECMNRQFIPLDQTMIRQDKKVANLLGRKKREYFSLLSA